MRTVFITGDPGAGKSYLLDRVVRCVGPTNVVGVISRPKTNAHGKRVGITAHLLPRGHDVDLARLARRGTDDRAQAVLADRPAAPPDAAGSRPSVPLGVWDFSASAIETVNRELTAVVEQARDHPAGSPGRFSVAVVDEIGPLELRRRQGFLPALTAMARSSVPLLVVVRPGLVDDLLRTLHALSSSRTAGHTSTVRLPRRPPHRHLRTPGTSSAFVPDHPVSSPTFADVFPTVAQILDMLGR